MQGLLMSSKTSILSTDAMIRLWVHECQRVFADRFVRTKTNDELKFRDILAKSMTDCLQRDWTSVMADSLEPKIGPLFCGLMTEVPAEEPPSQSQKYHFNNKHPKLQ